MLGEAIKFHRTKKALSVKELAKRLNVSEDAVRFWELGIRQPKLDNIRKLAEIFGIEVEQLTQYYKGGK